MKTIKWWSVMLFIWMAGWSNAQGENFLNLTSTAGTAEGTWTINIELVNDSTSQFTAFLLDVDIPRGLSYVDNSVTPDFRLFAHHCSANMLDRNTLRIVGYAANNMVIPDTKGNILSFALKVADNAPERDYTLTVTQANFVERNGMDKYFKTVAHTVTYQKQRYTLTYILDGVLFGEQQWKAGETIVPLEVADTPETKFLGWEGLPETMPAGPVTIYGKTAPTGIEELTSDTLVSVYNLQGVMVLEGVRYEKIRELLPRGVYIVNGNKVTVR